MRATGGAFNFARPSPVSPWDPAEAFVEPAGWKALAWSVVISAGVPGALIL
jgi:hypothetical protein